MIGKITPLVQEAGRRTWLKAVTGHLIGAVLSAGVLGFVLGTCGLTIGLDNLRVQLDTLGGAILLFCAFWDVGVIPWRRPAWRRQTPSWCLCSFGPLWGSFAWGVDLAQGWTTFITFSGYYGLIVWAMLGASPVEGTLILSMYGLGRVLPVIVTGLFAKRVTLSSLAASHLRLLPTIERINAVTLAFVAGYLFLA